jgi:hypothetical protein
MGLGPAKFHEKLGIIALPDLVGRTPWSAADAPVGLLAPHRMLMSLFRQRDEGVLAQRAPRPGGPPHHASGFRLCPGFPGFRAYNGTCRLPPPFAGSRAMRGAY